MPIRKIASLWYLSRLIAEALRPVSDDGPELCRGQDQDSDELRMELERLRQGCLDLPLDPIAPWLELRITLPLAMYVTTSS